MSQNLWISLWSFLHLLIWQVSNLISSQVHFWKLFAECCTGYWVLVEKNIQKILVWSLWSSVFILSLISYPLPLFQTRCLCSFHAGSNLSNIFRRYVQLFPVAYRNLKNIFGKHVYRLDCLEEFMSKSFGISFMTLQNFTWFYMSFSSQHYLTETMTLLWLSYLFF